MKQRARISNISLLLVYLSFVGITDITAVQSLSVFNQLGHSCEIEITKGRNNPNSFDKKLILHANDVSPIVRFLTSDLPLTLKIFYKLNPALNSNFLIGQFTLTQENFDGEYISIHLKYNARGEVDLPDQYSPHSSSDESWTLTHEQYSNIPEQPSPPG